MRPVAKVGAGAPTCEPCGGVGQVWVAGSGHVLCATCMGRGHRRAAEASTTTPSAEHGGLPFEVSYTLGGKRHTVTLWAADAVDAERRARHFARLQQDSKVLRWKAEIISVAAAKGRDD